MKKLGIIVAMVTWISLSARYIAESFLKDADILSAFQTLDYTTVSAKVVAYGTYDAYMDNADRETFVKNITSELGIMAPYEIESEVSDEKEFCCCSKSSDNGNIKVELVYADNKNHLGISLDLKSNINYVYDYEELIKDIFAAKEIDGKVNIYLEGRMEGALNYEERSYIADSMLKILDAKVVSENRDTDIFTVYAYSTKIPEYIKSVGRKINVNVSSVYDEQKNETVIYLASPMNNLDY